MSEEALICPTCKKSDVFRFVFDKEWGILDMECHGCKKIFSLSDTLIYLIKQEFLPEEERD